MASMHISNLHQEAGSNVASPTAEKLDIEQVASKIPYGKISAESLASAGCKHVFFANYIFDAIDADRDGCITRLELSDYLMSRDNWLMYSEVEKLFAALDTNTDNFVSRDELHAALDVTNVAGKPLAFWLMALLPPRAGVGIFTELARFDGPVEIPHAAHRAMTLRQLIETCNHAAKRCRAEGWLGMRFEGGKHYERLRAEDINLYDVARHVILPATHAQQLPDSTTRPSFVEMVAEGEQPPDFFVSHFWGEPIADFVACIAQHTRDRAYGGGSFNTLHNEEGFDGLDGRVWVCAYANRQWDLAHDVTVDPRDTSFAHAMRLASGTIAVVDAAGMYYKRVWCDFEIWMSLQMEKERDLDAQAKGPYTFDIYTKLLNTPGCRFGSMGKRQAVGLVDGIAPADTGFAAAEYGAGWKAVREAAFPSELLHHGLRARVEDGEASVASDQQHILNCIVGNGRELNAEVLTVHPQYDIVNTMLHGRLAAVTLRVAIVAGGELLEAALQALKVSSVTRVGVMLDNCEAATAQVQEQLVAALPASLEFLSLRYCSELQTLDVSRFTQLQTLDLNGCCKLRTLHNLSKLTQLQTLNLSGCCGFSSLPNLSALTKLADFTKPDGSHTSGIEMMWQDECDTEVFVNCCTRIFC